MTSEDFIRLMEGSIQDYRVEFRDMVATSRSKLFSIAGEEAADKYSAAIEDLEETRLQMEANTLETIRELASLPEEIRNIAAIPVMKTYTDGFRHIVEVQLQLIMRELRNK